MQPVGRGDPETTALPACSERDIVPVSFMGCAFIRKQSPHFLQSRYVSSAGQRPYLLHSGSFLSQIHLFNKTKYHF